MQDSDITTVTAGIILKDGCVLLARRNRNKTLGGMWEFPGGKQEIGETLTECLERELLEELGVSSKAGSVFIESRHQYTDLEIDLIGIFATIDSENFVLVDHDEVAWVQVRDLIKYNLSPADIPISNELIKQLVLQK